MICGEDNNKKLQFVIKENFKRYLAKLLKEKQSKDLGLEQNSGN